MILYILYEYETWFVTLRKEQRLIVFGNKVLSNVWV